MPQENDIIICYRKFTTGSIPVSNAYPADLVRSRAAAQWSYQIGMDGLDEVVLSA